MAIRHRLNDHLLEVGGHIGYDVRPSRRREGRRGVTLRYWIETDDPPAGA